MDQEDLLKLEDEYNKVVQNKREHNMVDLNIRLVRIKNKHSLDYATHTGVLDQ